LEWRAPDFTPMEDGAVFPAGGTTLRIEHHPGHTPGHVWVVEESGAIFVGDYVIADHPTNAGLEIDRSQPNGRAPLLEQYNDGLRELARREAPVLFPAHGPPINDHPALIERRLAKTDRRTRGVLRALEDSPGVTALELGRRMYRSRAETSWEVLSDLVGRLDLLVAEGHATSRMGEDGAWHFQANRGGNRHA
jgi:glyoxylase-like metal-dependent hydrolase (beta-lactamase superfamily II)